MIASLLGRTRNAESLRAPLRIFLVRHGETDWSRSGQYTGRTDLPLTARGEDEARALGARIQRISFARVLTSPLQRAQQTCDLAGLATPSEIEPDLTEWDHGDIEGRFSADVLKSRPGWNLFRDGAPHGETPAEIASRADGFIIRLRAMEANIALFTHGHFGRVLAARWVGLTVAQAQHFLLDTASLGILCYEHDRPGEPAIALWNSAAHETFNLPFGERVGDMRSMKQRAIERWENEGGEIPTDLVPVVR